MSESRVHTLEHTRFGRIELSDDALLYCDGLPGFPEAQRLALLDHDRPSWFAWLVSLELPDLAFAVTDPCRFYPEYCPRAHLSDLRAIAAGPSDEVDVLVIANVTGRGSFLNLSAPLLVNPRSRRVIQAILADSKWPLWAPLAPQPATLDATQIESNPHR